MNGKTMLKMIGKRVAAWLLVFLILFGLLPGLELGGGFVIEASAAEVSNGRGTWISGKLDYSYSVKTSSDNTTNASGSVSVASNGVLIVNAHRADSYETSGCNATTVAAADTTTTVTVTNVSAYPLKIATLNTNATVSGVAKGDVIASGATFTITVTASSSASSEVSKSVEIAVEELTSVEITLAPSPYVGYTVNGHTVAQNGSAQTFSAKVGDSITLPSVTAPAGYEFKGWRVGNDIVTGNSFTANSALTVFPVIVTAGTDLTAANFKVGNNTYTFWEDAMVAAIAANKPVFVNAAEVTLPSSVLDNLLPAAGGTYVKPVSGGGVEYVVPGGVTLVVPYSTSTTVHTTTPAYAFEAHVNPTPFRTLTVPNGAKITVNGAVSVDSKVCTQGQNANSWNGTPTGPHGKIVMKTGSEMTFNSGANLYCWGYINGDGHLYMNSGAKVYELFQLRCWRGGTATSAMPDNEYFVFPLNQYYVQNVEAPMTLYYGATEYVWTVVNMKDTAFPVQSPAEFIGSGGMFRLSSGASVTKRYHANTDHLELEVNGDLELSPMYLMIPISFAIVNYDVEIKTQNYVLPITNNMDITIHSGTTSINTAQTHGVAFLPGAVLTIDEGATFNVNAPVYFYDAEDWGNYGAGGLKMVPVGYSTANGTTAIRTADNLEDAVLDVNGTVNVTNKLYTTEHGAHFTSSEGTGVIRFTSDCATDTATTYQATQSGSDITYDPITVNNAWLYNGVESYSETVSTGTSTWKYDKPGEHWYRYKVDFVFNGSTVATGYYCENNDTVDYDASWLDNLGASVTSGTATAAIDGSTVNVTGVTADSVVTLTGVAKEYMPTFVLNEREYAHYQMYTGATLSNTTTINGETYYIVEQGSALAVGTTYAAPTNAEMGETAENHNRFLWNLSGVSFTSGDPYRGTVPAGETAQGPAYIYGFYAGAVAHNSWNDQYYPTLIGAFEVLPQDVTATITLLADCGTFEKESGTTAYTAYAANNVTLNLNGHHAVGRIVNKGTFTLELNGGTLDYHTGATAMAAAYQGMATVVNSGTMTVRDSVGGGSISSDALSNTSGADGSAVIRNNAGATLTVTGKDSDHLLTLALTNETELFNGSNSSPNYYPYNYGMYNLGRITALTNVNFTTTQSRTCGANLYNYNTGMVGSITDCHMFSAGYASIFNYGGNIDTISNVTIDGKNGITNRNIVTGALASGYIVTDADKGVIDTITNCHIEVGQYAIYNHAVINTLSNSTFIAHPDSAQVDTRGNGTTASEGNVQCYTVYNDKDWWYNTNVWKRVDSSKNGYTRVDTYKEEEQYRPYIGTITNCEIYAENTSTSASHGYTLYNAGVIGTIGGTTNIKSYKHPNNTKISTSSYALLNTNGGIVKSIEGTVNLSATASYAAYNDGVFTTQINYTYGNNVGGNVTHQFITYGDPSTINSVTCDGTWSVAGSYALYNGGYIRTINAPGLTLTGNNSVLHNTTAGANSTYEKTQKYTDVATASTEYERNTSYVKNLDKGSTIGTLRGVTINLTGTKAYYGINNQGHIGTLADVTMSFAEGATAHTSYYALLLNGDSRYQSYTETIQTNRTPETDPHLTVTAGIATRYDRDYTYSVPTIDEIDNLTLTSITYYGLRNAGTIGTLKNSTITATRYALQNFTSGPYTERQTLQYYSDTSIFGTTKTPSSSAEQVKHYVRNPSTINLIDNCTITTPASTYAMINGGHVGTIQNSTIQAGTTTAAAYALANAGNREREYTRNLEEILYITANARTACTYYVGSGGESNVVTYDYDAPTIDLIGEGNTFKATTTVLANTGIITAIDSGEGTLTTITGTAAKGSTIYNCSACLDARTTTTPYTAAATASASGTAGTAVNDDTFLSGAQIGTIKNVYINANGYGILNGDAAAGKLPVIGEIGEGTEIYAHCTTQGYHAIYNNTYGKIEAITGGVFNTKKATTNAYKNNNTDPELATLISGGDFKGTSNTRANAIFEPDNTNRQTYPTGYKLSTTTENVNLHDGTTAPCYFIAKLVTVTFDMQGHGTENTPANQTVESGEKATAPTAPAADATVNENNSFYRFDGWYTTDQCTTAFDFDTVVTADTTVYAKWTELTPTAKIGTTNYLTLAAAVAAAQNGNTVTMLANETLSTMVAIEGKSITLDLNGHTVSRNTASTIQIKNTGSLTVRDSGQNGKVLATAATAGSSDAIVVLAGGTFTLESGTIQSNTYGISTLGTVTVTGGTVIGDTGVLYSLDSGTIAVSGGWFSHAVSSNDCAAGYHPITDATHDPQYTVSNLYTITWVDGDGTTLKTEQVAYGQTPAYTGETPTKTATAQYTYTFAGWSTDGETAIDPLPAVTGDETYTAIFTAVPNHVHSLEYHQAVAATCTEAGNSAYWSCACGKYFSDAEGNTEIAANSWVISATGHTVVTDAAVAATCTESGLTEGSHCSVCNEILTAQETVAALGHDVVTDPAVAATCTETGLTAGEHCTRCDYAVAQEVVPALGHDIVTDAAVAATCTETGLTAGEHCTRCDYAVAQETVPALGHDIVTDAAVAATCTETGLTEGSHCTRCDYAVAQETVPALGHDIVTDAAVAATCTETGLTEGSHCSRCDYAVAQETVPALGHDIVTDAAVAATCTKTGLTAGEHCTRCDYAVAQETVPALGHDIVTDAAVAATCTKTGLTAGEHCSRCDYAVAQETVPATGHTPAEAVRENEAAATCTAAGSYDEVVYCSVCNAELSREAKTIEKLAHTPAAAVEENRVEATETTAGSYDEVVYCSVCHEELSRETKEIPALGHTHTPVLTPAVEATCTESGSEAYYTCSGCGKYFSDEECTHEIEEDAWVTEALGHNIVTDAAVAATCTEPGLTAGEHCTRCNYAVAQEVVPALGHDLVTHEFVEATCTADGNNEYFECTRCGKFFDDTNEEINPADFAIPATGHSLVEHEGQEPTCLEAGWAAYQTCTKCDYTTYTELPALGHNFVDGFCTRCGLGDGTNTAFKIASAKLSISKDIVVIYAGAVPDTMTDPYMVFTFNGRDYRVTSSGKDANGRYVFNFEGVTPEKMGDNICATLYATTAAGQLVSVCKDTYSVRQYCVNTMAKYPSMEKLQTLLADILVYGEKAQIYTKYRTDALVTEGVDLTHASTFEPLTETKLNRAGEEDAELKWISASLQCGSKMAMHFTFSTTCPEVTTVEVTVNGRTAVYDIPQARINSNGTYTTIFTGISATEFDAPVTAILKKDGVQVGQTLTYSVNSYVYSMQNNTSVPNLAELVKAIYNYGESAKAYAGN